MNPLRSVDGVGAEAKRGRRGLGESGGSLGSRVERLRIDSIGR